MDVRLPVHDSILVQCRETEAEAVAKTMKEVMETTATEVFSDYVPFPVDIGIGKSWGDLH
jgi:DNA polymerase I-like protein with 3'-5' exonuclease and polymerase domains